MLRSYRLALRFRCAGLAMVEAALLVVWLAALVAAAIVVRRLTVIAARLEKAIDAIRDVREEIRRLY